MKEDNSWYVTGAWIAGVLIMLYVWLIYSTEQWGFLFGIMFGWIPGAIAGAIGGLLWPVLALLIAYILLQGS